jgi:hypothetical protein
MPDNIGERLLNDPKRRLVDGHRQPSKIILRVLMDQGHLSTGRPQAVHQVIESSQSGQRTSRLLRV